MKPQPSVKVWPDARQESKRTTPRFAAAAFIFLLVFSGLSLDAVGQVPTSGLVAYYPFRGNVEDASGNGRHGALIGNPMPTQDRWGHPAAAYEFGDPADYVIVPGSENLHLQSGISLCTWFRADVSAAQDFLVGKHVAGYRNGYFLMLEFDTMLWAVGDTSVSEGVLKVPDGRFHDGRWHYVVGTCDETTARLYIDGALRGVLDVRRAPPNGVPFTVGKIAAGEAFFHGSLDEVRLYDRALSEAEVRALFHYDAHPTNAAPTAFIHPKNQQVLAGTAAILDVFAFGSEPLHYQWRFKGTNLTGANMDILTLASVRKADEGAYDVVVTNNFGSVTSQVAVLTVRELFPNGQGVYYADFESDVGSEWSEGITDVTLVGNRRFLGQFGNQTISLNLSNLPEHASVTIAFDLFVIESWDGSDCAGCAPDIWELSVPGGPPLLRTTFSNVEGNDIQAFPGTFPDDHYPRRTGAAETNTLGYYAYGDAVYYLTFTFPHTADFVRVDFSATTIDFQEEWRESWGLDNVRVSVGAPPTNSLYVKTSLASGAAINPEPGASIEKVAASGNRAVVLDDVGGVHLMDLSDTAHPRLLGTWEPLFPPTDVKVVGDRVYVSSFEPGFLSTIEIVDFADPAQPNLLGYYDLPGQAVELAVQGTTVYVADWEQGLLILDASDPAWPRRISGFDTLGHIGGINVSGRYAYASDGNWLIILDVQDPGNPRRLGFYEAGSDIQTMEPRGNRLYLAESSGDLRILDVTEPRNILELGSYRGWGAAPKGVAVSGSFACLARGSAGLQVINVSDPANPTWQTGTGAGATALDAATAGTRILVAGGEQGLLVYELNQTLNPPLRTPVIEDGKLVFSWPTGEVVRLQKSTNLASRIWVDVPGSDLTNLVIVPSTEPSAFYRLAKGPKRIQPPSGLVAWWTGDGDAQDLLGNNHGTLMNGVTFEPGVVGQAFSFDGVDDFVALPSSNAFYDPVNGFTWHAWVKPLSGGTVLAAADAAPCEDFQMGFGPVNVGIWIPADSVWAGADGIGCGAQRTFEGPSPGGIAIGEWYQLALVVDYPFATAHLYLDGEEVGSTQLVGTRIDRNMFVSIGTHRYAEQEIIASFRGLVDEVCIYNRPLTSVEIRSIYQADTAGMIKPAP